MQAGGTNIFRGRLRYEDSQRDLMIAGIVKTGDFVRPAVTRPFK